MKKIVNFVKDVIRFVTKDIWSKHDSEYDSTFMRNAARHLKVFMFTAKSYVQDNLDIRSAALSLYTLTALVPLAALIFGIAKGFMFDTSIAEWLHEKFPDYTGFVDYILEFANNMIARTRGGVIASIGLVLLLWSVVKVFNNIENAFNHIWKVKRPRSITRKISDYLSVMLIAPIFWFVSNNASRVVGDQIMSWVESTFLYPVLEVLGYLVPFLVYWIVLTVVYFVMPNTKVKVGAAFKSAIIVGTVFYLFQIGYTYVQSMLTSYNVIYGSFAAIPLFLIWLQISWQIILFGAELSFGYQNIESYEYEQESSFISSDYRRRATVLVMYKVARNFADGNPPVDSEYLSRKLYLPVTVVRNVLYDLEQADLVVGVNDDEKKVNRYLPAHDVSDMKIWDVIKRVESVGEDISEIANKGTLRDVNEVIHEFDSMINISDKNILLLDLEKNEEK